MEETEKLECSMAVRRTCGLTDDEIKEALKVIDGRVDGNIP
jgi:Ca2+-binding EF-hand superfamily protein